MIIDNKMLKNLIYYLNFLEKFFLIKLYSKIKILKMQTFERENIL